MSVNNENPLISIASFVKDSPNELRLEVLSGEESLQKSSLSSARVQKLGLSLAGFAHHIHKGRLQVIGQSEISYLSQLKKEDRENSLKNLDLLSISCILVTKNLEPPVELLKIARKNKLPVLRTPLVSSKAIAAVSGFLERNLAPQITLHGVMLGMYGIGLLILGESGIGKSECALDLITRGHRLVSDDSVVIRKIDDSLEATSPDITREHLEIRGLGIIDIRDLFGVSAIEKRKKIDLCIKLEKWADVVDVDRLGLKMQEEEIFGVKIPKFVLPVSSGRNITTLVEIAVRVYLLRIAGHDATQKLIEKHANAVSRKN